MWSDEHSQDADSVNHVVIFLTGAVPFPEGTTIHTHGNAPVDKLCEQSMHLTDTGMGGSVYFCWPQPDGVGQVTGVIIIASHYPGF